MIRKVLLVDDEADIRKIASLTLTHIGGWEVVQASSGPEALEKAARERPDVILLDVMMPGMDGPFDARGASRERRDGVDPGRLRDGEDSGVGARTHLALGSRGDHRQAVRCNALVRRGEANRRGRGA